MKKRNELTAVIIPVVISLSLYVVFNSRINCTPKEAGFWIIFVMGLSFGVALTRLLMRENKKD